LEDRTYVHRLMAEFRRSDCGPLRVVVPLVMMPTKLHDYRLPPPSR
jgi:hypothetical protein